VALPTQFIYTYEMKKNSKPDRQRPPHFPFEDPPFRLSLGLLKIPEAEWFEVFDLQERALQMAEKRKLLANSQNEVFIADSSAMTASTEVLNLMLEHLPSIRPELYSLRENTIKLEPHTMFGGDEWSTDLKTNKMHPLDLAARLVQEDLIIMLPPDNRKTQTSKGWWLAAGSVAFPSRWSLKKKFRQTMDAIHAPVPFYKEQLQAPTNGFFDLMPVNEIFSRRNWSLHDNPSLRQDGAEKMSEGDRITSVNAGEHLWLRVERQTLRKLKKTGAILFTIRIHLRQLKHVVKFQGIAKRIAKALSALPPEMQTYKQTDTFADSVQDYLNQF
jgi:dimethylamine monooxygenase subunit A